jgi:hypothetical protein
MFTDRFATDKTSIAKKKIKIIREIYCAKVKYININC